MDAGDSGTDAVSPAVPVYIINNMTIHDRAAYERYLRAFIGVYRLFKGSVLAAQERPQPLEGSWPYDRTVLLSFPSREDATAWINSPEYQAIVGDRHAGTLSNVVMLDGLTQPPPSA